MINFEGGKDEGRKEKKCKIIAGWPAVGRHDYIIHKPFSKRPTFVLWTHVWASWRSHLIAYYAPTLPSIWNFLPQELGWMVASEYISYSSPSSPEFELNGQAFSLSQQSFSSWRHSSARESCYSACGVPNPEMLRRLDYSGAERRVPAQWTFEGLCAWCV